VRFNDVKHGLTARELLISDDELEQFQELLAGLIQDVAPDGALQTTIFNQLLHAAWNLRRARIMEADLGRSGDPLTDDELARKLDRLARHQARLDRTFHRCLREIKLLQTNAVFKKTYEETAGEPLPSMADAKEVAKQSQKLSAEALYEEVFRKMTRRDNAAFAAMNVQIARRDAEKEEKAA
jgi:hypothetical protein